jgi:hypothetical protein
VLETDFHVEKLIGQSVVAEGAPYGFDRIKADRVGVVDELDTDR